VPQGCPTSCGLSTIILDQITRNQDDDPLGILKIKGKPISELMKVIMYADDGIIVTEDEILIERVKNYLKTIKVEIEETKSGFVKKDGK